MRHRHILLYLHESYHRNVENKMILINFEFLNNINHRRVLVKDNRSIPSSRFMLILFFRADFCRVGI